MVFVRPASPMMCPMEYDEDEASIKRLWQPARCRSLFLCTGTCIGLGPMLYIHSSLNEVESAYKMRDRVLR